MSRPNPTIDLTLDYQPRARRRPSPEPHQEPHQEHQEQPTSVTLQKAQHQLAEAQQRQQYRHQRARQAQLEQEQEEQQVSSGEITTLDDPVDTLATTGHQESERELQEYLAQLQRQVQDKRKQQKQEKQETEGGHLKQQWMKQQHGPRNQVLPAAVQESDGDSMGVAKNGWHPQELQAHLQRIHMTPRLMEERVTRVEDSPILGKPQPPQLTHQFQQLDNNIDAYSSDFEDAPASTIPLQLEVVEEDVDEEEIPTILEVELHDEEAPQLQQNVQPQQVAQQQSVQSMPPATVKPSANATKETQTSLPFPSPSSHEEQPQPQVPQLHLQVPQPQLHPSAYTQFSVSPNAIALQHLLTGQLRLIEEFLARNRDLTRAQLEAVHWSKVYASDSHPHPGEPEPAPCPLLHVVQPQ